MSLNIRFTNAPPVLFWENCPKTRGNLPAFTPHGKVFLKRKRKKQTENIPDVADGEPLVHNAAYEKTGSSLFPASFYSPSG